MIDRTPIWSLIGGDTGSKLSRPKPIRDRYGKLRRNPAGEWDWFYSLDDGLQAYFRRHLMAADGLTPDDCAAIHGYGYDVDSWADDLVAAVKVVRAGTDDWTGDYAADDDADLIGPDEFAQLLGVDRATIRQWRRRGILPDVYLIISDMPIWTLGTIREWAARTNRTLEDVA